MDFPDFLKPTVTVSIRKTPSPSVSQVTASGGTARPPTASASNILALSDYKQEQDHWCWAAVGVNVARFYDPHVAVSQCQVVNAALSRSDCCSDPAASDVNGCNVDGYLEVALKTTQSFHAMIRGRMTFQNVQSQVDADRVPCCRVAWFGGGAHFLAVKGWVVGSSGVEYIWITDPIFLTSRVAFSQFASN